MLRRVMVLVAAVALGLAGCGVGEIDTDIAAGTTLQSEFEEKAEMNTIEPPEDGWTLELLNQVVYLNGKHITFPLKLSDLGEEYEFGESHKYAPYYDSETGYLYKKGAEYFDDFWIEVYFNHIDDDIIIYGFANTFLPKYISINGLKIGDSVDDIEKRLGMFYDDFPYNNNYQYSVSGFDIILGEIVIITDRNNKVSQIFVFVKNKIEEEF